MSTMKITAPVPGLNGLGVGGLEFVDSVAYTDNEAIIAYCADAGYEVEDSDNESGTAVRDAAIDPAPDDYIVPTNAGQAAPSGPEVVSPPLEGGPSNPEAESIDLEVQNAVIGHNAETPGTTPPLESPAGNASREDWADFALAKGATAEEIADLSRDDLRELFSKSDQA